MINSDQLFRNSRPCSARRASWLFLKAPEDLEGDERTILEHLKEVGESVVLVYRLGQEFLSLVRERLAQKLDGWMASVMNSGIPALKSFVNGITQDLEAVKAACSLPWSNGQTEGHINRLKTLKRQMYGRANMALLKIRFLHRLDFQTKSLHEK